MYQRDIKVGRLLEAMQKTAEGDAQFALLQDFI
jgi:hypothetical protein